MTRCKIWGSNTHVAESGGCVPCEAVLLGELFPRFWRIIVPSASWVMQPQNCLTLALQPYDTSGNTLQTMSHIPQNLTQTDKIDTFIHSIGMCRLWRFLAVLKSFFRSSLLCTSSCYPSPPTILPSSLTSSSHPFLGLPLNHSYIVHFWGMGSGTLGSRNPQNYRRICATTSFT